MAAATIMNLLFLSILVKWSISWWKPSTSLQNFIHLRQSAAELLMFVQKSKMAAVAILNYNFLMLDHPRSPFVHLKFPFKFGVDRVRTFRDIVIHKFGLKCLFRPPKSCFWGVLTSKHYFFYHRDPKWPYLTRKHALSQACASTALC